MASTFSSYKFELIGAGEQAGSWDVTTNANLGTAIEQAIGGYVSLTFTGISKTISLTNTNAAQNARALYLNCTGSPGGAATLNVPSITKMYILRNATTGGYPVTIKVAGQTGIQVVNGTTAAVYVNGTDVVRSNSVLETIIIACSDETTALTTGTAKVTFRVPFAMTLTSVRGSLTTAQTSGSIVTVDINDSGTTILSTKLTFDNTEKTSTTATQPVLSDTSLADDAEITIDIDQVGDGTAKGLKVTLIGYRT